MNYNILYLVVLVIFGLSSCVVTPLGRDTSPEPTASSTSDVHKSDFETFEFSPFNPVVADPETFKGTDGEQLFCIPKDESLILIDEMRQARDIIKRLQTGCGY